MATFTLTGTFAHQDAATTPIVNTKISIAADPYPLSTKLLALGKVVATDASGQISVPLTTGVAGLYYVVRSLAKNQVFKPIRFLAPASGTVDITSLVFYNPGTPPLEQDLINIRDAALAAVAAVKIGTWQAATAYVSGQTVQFPDGTLQKSLSSRTSRASLDITELTFWRPTYNNFLPETFGAVGDGVTDDTAAVVAAFTNANAFRRTNGTYSDPGARVVMRGIYNLATLAAPIPVMCHLAASGAEILAPSGYTGNVMEIGHATSGSVLQNAEIEAPSVTGATTATMATLPVGSQGVVIRNLYSSRVRVGKITYFETALRVGGQSWGVAYNEIGWRTISFSKVCVKLAGLDAGGWSNQNTFIAGSVTGSSTWAGGRRAAGTRAVVLDGTGSQTVTGNTFVGCSFESDTFEHAIEVKNGYQNVWLGCRHEQGIAGAAVTVSGDTFTAAGHPFAVDEMVILTGTSAPTGTFFDRPYYIVAVTSTTFKLSLRRGGTAITTTSAGTGVQYLRPQRVRFENATDNVIRNPMSPLVWLEKNESGTPAGTAGNAIHYAQGQTTDSYIPGAWPLHRARNRFSSGTTPLWAAYPSGTNPYEDPSGWTAAVSDLGFFLGAGGAAGSIQANSGGTLRWIRPSDTSAFELASCQRTQSARVLTNGTAYTAGSRTTGTITLTGAAVGDYVTWSSLSGMLPFGLVITAQITATDTITYAIDNVTAGTITLAASFSLFFMATRRFF